MGDNWITIVSVAILLISALVLTLLVVVRNRPRRHNLWRAGRYADVSPPARHDNVATVDPRTQVIGERLLEVEQQLRLVAERQDQIDLRQPARQPYRLAINLARQGAEVDKLVATCGISRGEAELVARLHRSNRVLKSSFSAT